MSQSTFEITGHILHSHNNEGISGLRAEAWDMDLLFDDLVDTRRTGALGKFTFERDRPILQRGLRIRNSTPSHKYQIYFEKFLL